MQDYQKLGTEIVAAPAAIEAGPHSAVTDYQKIEAEFARYEAEAAAIKQRMDALNEQRESLREQERVIAIPELKARIAALGITPEDLGYAPRPKTSKASSIPRYRDPVTGKKHSGKGGLPDWLTPETKLDPLYENPEWTAKKAAADVAKKDKSSSADVSVEASASNVAAAVSNDAPTMTDGAAYPASNDSPPATVADVAVVDMAHVETNAATEAYASNLN